MNRESTAEAHGTADQARVAVERRRTVLVDPAYQLRAGMTVGLVAFVLLLLLNLTLMSEGTRAPGAEGASWILLLAGSAILLGGIVLVGVVEAHRTAGAAFALRRTIDALTTGQRGARVRLRKGDHLKDVADAVNRLADALDAERDARR